MREFLAAFIALALLASPAFAQKRYKPGQEPPMPAGFDDPGPEPENLIGQIVTGLKGTLKDPYSIRDFSLCQSRIRDASKPIYVGIKWGPAHRLTLFQLRAKNGFGAYSGVQDGVATFKQGKLSNVFLHPTVNGDSPDEQRAIAWRGECTRIDDAQIQKLLAG